MANALLRAGLAFHVGVFRMSKGRLLAKFGNAPVLLLTTTGRQSGKRRTMPLLYLEDGGAIAIVASNGGADRHPAWYHNLVANPEVEVEMGGSTRRMRAEVTASAERDRLYDRFKARDENYAKYEAKTSRTIPVVLLRAAG